MFDWRGVENWRWFLRETPLWSISEVWGFSKNLDTKIRKLKVFSCKLDFFFFQACCLFLFLVCFNWNRMFDWLNELNYLNLLWRSMMGACHTEVDSLQMKWNEAFLTISQLILYQSTKCLKSTIEDRNKVNWQSV